jgi:hypothetical protein
VRPIGESPTEAQPRAVVDPTIVLHKLHHFRAAKSPPKRDEQD